jgi:hypothetical protein
MSTRCELDFGVQVEVEADVFEGGKGSLGRDVSRRAELFSSFRFEYQSCRRKTSTKGAGD